MLILLGVCVVLILLLVLFLKESMQDTTNLEIQAINRGYAYYHHATKKFTWEKPEDVVIKEDTSKATTN